MIQFVANKAREGPSLRIKRVYLIVFLDGALEQKLFRRLFLGWMTLYWQKMRQYLPVHP